jgi:hypothetical protein
MDFLCIIRTIIKHKARGPAYFGMQAFSISGGGCDDSALWGRINKRER